jgi:hypothetical protein
MTITCIGITVVPGVELNIPTNLELSEALDFLDPFLEDGGSFVPCYIHDPYRQFTEFSCGDEERTGPIH